MQVKYYISSIIILIGISVCLSQNNFLSYDVISYDSGEWWPDGPIAVRKEPLIPDTIPCNLTNIWGILPILGYPMRPATFKGLNDTLQVLISFKNRTKQPYSLVGKSPEKWFAPRVFRNNDDASTSIPLMDSTELKYRVRQWRSGVWKTQSRDTISAGQDGKWSIVFDVWNLPPGFNTIVAAPTASIPNNFYPRIDGNWYEYLKAQNLADSVNAYEGCFWRAVYDSNFSAAKDWSDKIFEINPNSVPGYWLQAYYYAYKQDTTKVKLSLDKAIGHLDEGDDPAMPDSTKKTLFPAEKHYLEYCKSRLKYERSQYAP